METRPVDSEPPRIVLLAGWSGTGKDTLGAYLCANQQFRRFAFADLVKDAAAARFGFDRALADTEEGKQATLPEYMNTVRNLIINHGEGEKQEHGADIWAIRLGEKIHEALASGHRRIVITDWRFPEEFVALHRLFPAATFYPLRLVRPGQRHSPVASMTEYSLCGWPMPEFNVEQVKRILAARDTLYRYLDL